MHLSPAETRDAIALLGRSPCLYQKQHIQKHEHLKTGLAEMHGNRTSAETQYYSKHFGPLQRFKAFSRNSRTFCSLPLSANLGFCANELPTQLFSKSRVVSREQTETFRAHRRYYGCPLYQFISSTLSWDE